MSESDGSTSKAEKGNDEFDAPEGEMHHESMQQTTEYDDQCTLVVEDVPSNIHSDDLELYFEAEELSGGGDVEKCIKDAEGKFIMVFQKPEEYDDQCTLVVEDVPSNIHSDELELYFEELSGGGDVEKCIKDAEGKFIMVFQKPEAVGRILGKSLHCIDDITISVKRWQPPAPKKTRSIKVTNFKPGTKKEMLDRFFCNRKRSGGGAVDSIEMHGDYCIVTFRTDEGFEGVLSRDSLLLSDHKLDIQQYNPEASLRREFAQNAAQQAPNAACNVEITEYDDQCTLVVEDVPSNIHSDELELYFEELSGGGDVEKCIKDAEGKFIMVFQKPEAVDRILGKSLHCIDDITIRVKRWQPPAPKKTRSIKVTNFKPGTKKETLRMFFSNKKKSGGGAVDDIEMHGDYCIVTFRTDEGFEGVLSRDSLLLSDHKLDVQQYQYAEQQGPNGALMVEITGLPPAVTKEALQMFLENKRITGGINVEEVQLYPKEVRAVATLSTMQDAENLSQIEHLQYCDADKTPLKLRWMKYDKLQRARPQYVRSDESDLPTEMSMHGDRGLDYAFDKDKVLLEEVPSDVTKEQLMQYIATSRYAVKTVVYGTEPGKVLVVFKDPPDLDALERFCNSKQLNDSWLAIQQVATPDSIQVHNEGQSSEDALSAYFESPRGGGKEVVSASKSGECVIVQFKDSKVVEEISKRRHTFEGNKLDVHVFYESLGVIPPGHDTSSPAAWITFCIEHSDVPEKILEFILYSSSDRSMIESRMEKVDTEVDWPLQPHGDVLLNCTLLQGSCDLTKACKWETLAKETFNDILQPMGHRSVSSLQKLWDRIQPEVKTQQAKLQTSALLLRFDKESTTIHMAGYSDEVKELADWTEKKEKELENELTRTALIVKEVLSLQKFQILLLVAAKFPVDEEGKYTDMKIQADVTGSKLIFHGFPKDITASQVAMKELLDDVKQQKIDVSKDFAELVVRKEMKKELEKFMKKQEWLAVWDADDRGITVYAVSAIDLGNTVRMLRTEVMEKSVDVQDSYLQCLESQEWKDLHTDLLSAYSGLISIKVIPNRQVIIIITLSALIELIAEDVVNFLMNNATQERFLPMDVGKARLIKEFMKNKLQSLGDNHDQSVAFSIPSDMSGIRVEGSNTALGTFIPKLQALVNAIIVADHRIDAPGMAQYFAEENGRLSLESIENRLKVAIEIAYDDMLRASPSTLGPVPVATVKSKVSIDANKSIVIAHGDITEYPVDAIVNAANVRLDHCGGLAKAIVDKGGSTIQDECHRHIEKNGHLLHSEVFVSGSGSLQCKKVIHAVGPEWQGGDANEENVLFEAVYNSLTAASENKCKSVAMPAISSGIFGFPASECARVILEAVNEALSERRLEQVHLIDSELKLVNSFHDAAVELFGKKKVVLESSASDPHSRGRGQESVGMATGGGFTTTDAPGSLKTPQGLIISNIQAVITQQQVDVIVNTTSTDLQLTNGSVSALILKDAGPTIQDEASKQAPVKNGEVVATSAGNLPCKAIYHGACVGIQDANCEQIFREFVSRCLTKACVKKYTTIAFPAIGTGNLGIPRQDVAQWMFEEVIKFSKDNPASTLKSVSFILYSGDQDTIKAFDVEMQGFVQSARKRTRPKVRMLDRKGIKADTAAGSRPYIAQKPRQSIHLATENPRAVYTGTAPVGEMQIGSIKLQVQQGDICDEQTDAIINSTNKDLDLSRGDVSQAIVRRGGQSIMDECKRIGGTDQNGIAVTSAGNLRCQYIIHVAANKQWKGLVRNSLIEAEKRGIESLAMPALGTGKLDGDAGKVASIILDGIASFVSNEKPKRLSLVRITVFKQDMIKHFLDEMKNRADADSGKNMALWKRVVAGFKDTFLWEYPDRNEVGATGGRPQRVSMEETNKESKKMTLQIYSDCPEKVDKVHSAIDQVCKEEIQGYTMDKPADQESIKNLIPGQIARIERLQKHYHASIKIERGRRLHRIQIFCNKEKQTDLISEIHTILRESDVGTREDQHADLISKQVQWEFNNGEKFEEYPPDINVIIEKAYLGKDDIAKWGEIDEQGQKVEYHIDFKKMKECEWDRASTVVPVRRMLPGGKGIELPDTWTPMASTETYKKVLLSKTTAEYETVLTNFTTSLAGTPGTVTKIERIQNRSLYQRYFVHREEMERMNTKGLTIERTLWHGTSAETMEQINVQGFNRSYCGKNATAYGDGVYFALNASYSAQPTYSVPDKDGQKHMYQVKVLCGEMAKGGSGMRAPPLKTAPATLYDSVTDKPARPTMIVIFSDTQAYPEYLITYK